MSLRENSRRTLLSAGLLLGLAGVVATLVLSRDNRSADAVVLPDFANQKVIYEPAIGATYTFTGVEAELLRPADLGAGWYYGNDPSAHRSGEGNGVSRRLVKATRSPQAAWKAETCVMQQVRRWPTAEAAVADVERLVSMIDVKGHRRFVLEDVTVTVLDTTSMRSAVFRRGNDVFNLNVCLRLATSDFSPAAADAVVEAAVRRSAG